MSHFGIFCPPIAGHINPLAALGRALTARGHRVTIFQVADLESKVRSERLEFAPLGNDVFPPGTLAGSVATLDWRSMGSQEWRREGRCREFRLPIRRAC
jgi:zeaxanthin glucosyltransferase